MRLVCVCVCKPTPYPVGAQRYPWLFVAGGVRAGAVTPASEDGR